MSQIVHGTYILKNIHLSENQINRVSYFYPAKLQLFTPRRKNINPLRVDVVTMFNF